MLTVAHSRRSGQSCGSGPQLYFGTSPNYQDEYPVWSRRITQAYPDQGVRIPYQEYLRAGHSTDDIICRVPRNAMLPFSYGGEHVSDDIAVAILERVIQSVKKVAADGYIVGDWEERLAWLNDVLAEVWHGRGPFPGAGSVLQYLGCSSGTSFQRTMLAPMMKEANKNPWDYVTSILEGTTMGPKHYRAELVKASERWNISNAVPADQLGQSTTHEPPHRLRHLHVSGSRGSRLNRSLPEP